MLLDVSWSAQVEHVNIYRILSATTGKTFSSNMFDSEALHVGPDASKNCRMNKTFSLSTDIPDTLPADVTRPIRAFVNNQYCPNLRVHNCVCIVWIINGHFVLGEGLTDNYKFTMEKAISKSELMIRWLHESVHIFFLTNRKRASSCFVLYLCPCLVPCVVA